MLHIPHTFQEDFNYSINRKLCGTQQLCKNKNHASVRVALQYTIIIIISGNRLTQKEYSRDVDKYNVNSSQGIFIQLKISLFTW